MIVYPSRTTAPRVPPWCPGAWQCARARPSRESFGEGHIPRGIAERTGRGCSAHRPPGPAGPGSWVKPRFSWVGCPIVFDVWKPLGAREVQRLPGGVGVVADDVIAGLAACGAFHLAWWGARALGWVG